MSFPSQQLSQVGTLKHPLAQLSQAETIVQSSPAREEGEVPESELDPDTRRRLLILQHGQDMREPPPSEPQFPARSTMQASLPRAQTRGWFPVEEEMSQGQLNRVGPPKEFGMNAESITDNIRAPHQPFLQKVEPSIPPGRVILENQRLPMEVSCVLYGPSRYTFVSTEAKVAFDGWQVLLILFGMCRHFREKIN